MYYSLSPSTLSLLKECKLCFWMHHNKGIKRPDGIFPSLPNGMDRVLKEHFDNFLEKEKLPPELEGNEHLQLFKRTDLLEEWRNAFKGLRFTDEKGNILRGAVDNIVVHNHKLVVLDYKTRGHPIKDETPKYYQDQMDIYSFLLQQNGFEVDDHAYLLFYYPLRVDIMGHVIFNTELVRINVYPENAKLLFETALAVLNAPMPKPDSSCQYCNWRKSMKESTEQRTLKF